MAQFFTDFSADTPDAAPTGWTERWHTTVAAPAVRNSGLPSGNSTTINQAMQLTFSSEERYAISWDAVGTPTGDVEILVLCYIPNSITDGMRVMICGGGDSSGETAYFAEMQSSLNTVRTIEYNAGSASLVDGSDAFTHGNDWYWVRMQKTSTTIRFRIWADGDSEPGTWINSATDSTLSGGWVGVGGFVDNDSRYIAIVGVGTGGDAAPSENPSTPVTISSVTAAASAAAPAPTVAVTSNATISSVTAEATSAALAPTVSAIQNPTITSVTAEADAAAPTPDVAGDATIASVTAEADAATPIPDVETGTVVTIESVTATASAAANAPDIEYDFEIASETAEADGAANAPTVSGDATIASATAEADGAALAPDVSTAGNVIITSVTAEADGAALAPTIATVFNLEIISVTATAAAAANAPDVGIDRVIASVVAAATGQAYAPVISIFDVGPAPGVAHAPRTPAPGRATVRIPAPGRARLSYD